MSGLRFVAKSGPARRRLRRLGRRVGAGLAVIAGLSVTALTPAAFGAGEWVVSTSSVSRVAPGGSFGMSIRVKNIGVQATDGSGALDVVLPPDLTGISLTGPSGGPLSDWSCGDPLGASSVHCDLTTPIAPGGFAQRVRLTVAADAGAAGPRTTTIDVSGGGSGHAGTTVPVNVSATPDFGPKVFDGLVTDAAGNGFTQAGGHPFAASTSFELKATTETTGRTVPDGGALRNVLVDLPAGFVGNPTVVSECPVDIFLKKEQPSLYLCPESSQIGMAAVVFSFPFAPFYDVPVPVYNLVPPPGIAASFGFIVSGVPIFLDARVKAQDGYHVQVSVPDASQTLALLGSSVTLWGVPADHAHDPERGCQGSVPSVTGCSAESAREAFITNPSHCLPAGQGFETRLAIDSWVNSGTFVGASFLSHDPPGFLLEPSPPTPFDPLVHGLLSDKWGPVQGTTGCEGLLFDPSMDAAPDTQAPDSPSGLSVDFRFPQDGLLNPDGVASAQLKRARVTLPEGMTVSPSSADGLAGCSDAQLGLGSDAPPTCPDAAKIGTVIAKSPLLDETLEGSVYVGTQASDDPGSGRMFRVFIVLENEARGILVKLVGEVRVKPDGQIETIFDNNPQVPVSEISLRLDSGPRAPLATPLECGRHTVSAELVSWNGQVANLQDSFTIDCPPDLGQFSPSFAAGALNTVGGAFTPLVFRIDRPDRQQFLSGVAVEMPGGMLAKLRGVPLCGDADATAGTCPVESRIGTATVGAGPGSNPFFLRGPVSLTGPYKGGPYGLSVAIRAAAGPFDLGMVVVRQAIYLDPADGHLAVVSDPLPVVVKGVPVRLRSVNVDVDRPGFAVNPTSCAEKQIAGTFNSTQGAVSRKTYRFQVAGCAKLGFSPKLSLRLTGRGQTTDGGHPGLRATLTQPRHQSGIKSVKLALPLSLALDPENAVSDTLCEFDEGQKPDPQCPRSSIIGRARAVTPLLNRPLTGNVYFVKNVRVDKRTGRRIRTLPTLLLALRGEVALNLRLATSISKGKLVSNLPTTPDAPVTSFDLTLKGGKKGILVVNGNACRRSRAADTAIAAQNKKQAVPRTIKIGMPCARRAP